MNETVDILIPLGKGSRHNNLELKYCLRSIEKHLSNVGNIFIIGECPDFVDKNIVIYIPYSENTNNWNRAYNIYKKIMVGCADKRLSNSFLFVNDDHFLLKDYDAAQFPNYHRGPLRVNTLKTNPPQTRQILNTIARLGAILDYDVHCPILYNKTLFRKVFEGLVWPEYGFCIKSMYANQWAEGSTIKTIQCDDLKFTEPLCNRDIYIKLKNRDWFSTGDKCLKTGHMKEVLQELYSNKSMYEKDL